MSTTETKREKQKAAKAKRAKSRQRSGSWDSLKKILKIAVPAIIIGGLAIWIITDSISSKKAAENAKNEGAATPGTEAENEQIPVDYSAYLTDDGKIKDINAADFVKLADLSSLTIKASEVEPSDEELEKALKDYMETVLITDEDVLIKDGDSINLDYIGYVDGEAFEGGNTNGKGTDLTIGSGKYIDDFEEQLIGHAPGENVTVEATFPENYGNEKLNGRDAVFEVTINGIYNEQLPSDEYIAENFPEYGSTYEELEASVKDNLKQQKIQDYAWNYVLENSEVSSCSEDYFNNLLKVFRYQYESEYNYYNEYYHSLAGEYKWESVYEYYDVDEEEYEQSIKDGANSEATYYMLAQTIFEKYDLSVTDEDIAGCIAKRGYKPDDLEGLVKTYGTGYLHQSAMGDVVSRYLAELAKVEE